MPAARRLSPPWAVEEPITASSHPLLLTDEAGIPSAESSAIRLTERGHAKAEVHAPPVRHHGRCNSVSNRRKRLAAASARAFAMSRAGSPSGAISASRPG